MPEEFDEVQKKETTIPKDQPIAFDFDIMYKNGKTTAIRTQFNGYPKEGGEYVTAEQVAEATISQIHNGFNRIGAIVSNPTVLLTDQDESTYLVNIGEVAEVRMKVRR